MLYRTIYANTLRLIPDILNSTFSERILEESGNQTLSIKVLQRSNLLIILRFSTLEQLDELVLALYPSTQTAEVLSFQSSQGLEEVYPQNNKVDLLAKEDLNLRVSRMPLFSR